MRLPGLILIAAALFLPAIWFVGMTADHHPIAVFSQYVGTVAIIAMGIVQLLATRWHGLETVFGGLDRIYVLHKWLGIGAMAAVLAHDTIDAELSGVTETVLSELGETLGEISLYGLLILVTMTIATFIPYHLWKWTHKFMGAFFAASAVHYLLVIKPFGVWEPVGLYVNAFCVLGIVCYAYTLVPFGRLQGRRGYKVTAVKHTGGAVALEMAPDGRGLTHRAGQFVFIGVKGSDPAMKEVHPFTVSSAPRDDQSLRLTVKPLGDDTRRLADRLAPGAEVGVAGPYGHFTGGGDRPVWIAAGVGITPFLALAEARPADAPPADLFFCVRDRDEAPHLEALEALVADKPSVRLHLVTSRTDGRLTAARIVETVGGKLNGVQVWFCGPEAMRESLRKALAGEGLPLSRFHHEEFKIRAGIDVGPLVRWLRKRLEGYLATRQTRTADGAAGGS